MAILFNPTTYLQKLLINPLKIKPTQPLKFLSQIHQSRRYNVSINHQIVQSEQPGAIQNQNNLQQQQQQRPPGLMIPGINCEPTCRLRYFLSSPLGKDIKQEQYLPLLTVFHKYQVRGSYQGWLAIVDTELDLYLLNPFSGTRINLPPVSKLPEKVILSASPSASDCMVVSIYGDCNKKAEFGFCNLGDKDWTMMECAPECCFIDGVFHKGMFYVVTDYGNVFTCDLTADKPKMVKVDPQLKEIQSEKQEWYLAEAGELFRIFKQKWYLVEAGGDLVRILRKIDASPEDKVEKEDEECSESEKEDDDDSDDSDKDCHEADDSSNNHRNDDESDDGGEECVHPIKYKTIQFEVDKLECSGAKAKWRKVKKLDGHAIFLGLNQSFSLPESQLSGYKGNRIYFTDDNIAGHKLFIHSGYDTGIFNLEDSTFEPIYRTDAESTKPPAVWVTPQTW